MEITLAQVQKSLCSYLPHYPESGHNGETLKQISIDYLEDLQDEGITSRELDVAVKHARRKCQFFPKISDILSSCKELRANPPRIIIDTLSIPEETGNYTEEELEQNKKRVQIICDQLNKKMTMEEAIDAQNKLVTFAM